MRERLVLAWFNAGAEWASCAPVDQETLDAGSKKVYCRCWLSDTFPLCNGAHMTHNKETGDNLGEGKRKRARASERAKGLVGAG